MCIPTTRIGLMITIYYISFAAGGMFYLVPEKIGRKGSVMWSAGLSLVA